MSRKSIALFLLMITAFFTVRPVIAMHYCMGEVHSYSLFQQYKMAPLCVEHKDKQQDKHSSSCCTSNNNENTTSALLIYDLYADGCCDNTFLELTTDNYQNITNSSIYKLAVTLLSGNKYLTCDISTRSSINTNSTQFCQEFPPEGLFIKHLSIHTYICIYRI